MGGHERTDERERDDPQFEGVDPHPIWHVGKPTAAFSVTAARRRPSVEP